MYVVTLCAVSAIRTSVVVVELVLISASNVICCRLECDDVVNKLDRLIDVVYFNSFRSSLNSIIDVD